jgi:hypothetical protein
MPTISENDWTIVKHFSPEEFDDPGFPGSHKHMDPKTVYLLDDLRADTGWGITTHNKFGLRGCVCMERTGHSPKSLHYPPFCSAVDFHFNCDADPRAQAMRVLASGFTGVGIYFDWRWGGRELPIGFHVDLRQRPQVWKRVNGDYAYLLR